MADHEVLIVGSGLVGAVVSGVAGKIGAKMSKAKRDRDELDKLDAIRASLDRMSSALELRDAEYKHRFEKLEEATERIERHDHEQREDIRAVIDATNRVVTRMDDVLKTMNQVISQVARGTTIQRGTVPR